MGDAFFHSDKKRKRPSRAGPSSGRPSRGGARGGAGGRANGRGAPRAPRDDRDDEVSDASSDAGVGGVDDMDFRAGRVDVPLGDDEVVDENETAAEKRVRLAKGYLAQVREEMEAERNDQDYDAAEIDRENIASRLQKDVDESQGRIHTHLASDISSVNHRMLASTPAPPTAVAITHNSIFLSTKRGTIFRYSLPLLKKVGQPFGQARLSGPKASGATNGHKGEILCLAASEDGKYLVSGGRDRLVGVWNVQEDEAKWIGALRGHKDAVTSVSLPPLDNPAYHILSASLSRHLALASVTTLSTIDTFFGHQDAITDVSALKPSAAVTAGSRDRTCRWWKVEEEVQLVLRGGGRTFENFAGIAPDPVKERLGGGWEVEKTDEAAKRAELETKGRKRGTEFIEGSIDSVCMLDDGHFVSGGDSGSISLWHTGKKKPIFTKPFAHGIEDLDGGGEAGKGGKSGKAARWITSLAALRGTDLFASGSWDGQIRLWALDKNLGSFSPAPVESIPVAGVVNCIRLISLPRGTIDSSSWRQPGAPAFTGSEQPVDSEEAAPKAKQDIVLAAAVGHEPRLGRWIRQKGDSKNGAFIAHIQTAPHPQPNLRVLA